MINGSCHCGRIKFTFTNPAIKRADCDCPDCQKATGALVAPFISTSPKQLSFTDIEPEVFTAENGEKCDIHGSWRFCSNCGSKLMWNSNNGELCDILLGTIENKDDIEFKEQ